MAATRCKPAATTVGGPNATCGLHGNHRATGQVRTGRALAIRTGHVAANGQQTSQGHQRIDQEVDANVLASGCTEPSGLSSPVLSTRSAASSSMERTGHVPSTPLAPMRSEEAQE